MQGMALIVISALVLSACASKAVSKHESIPETQEMTLSPVSLYAPSQLNVGAQKLKSGEFVLLVSDDLGRPVNKQKPLLVNVDGKTVPLAYDSELRVEDNILWHRYRVNPLLLRDLVESEHAMMRLYLDQGHVEARVSGTQSDYLSRPRAYGVQGRLKKFMADSVIAETGS